MRYQNGDGELYPDAKFITQLVIENEIDFAFVRFLRIIVES